MRNKGGLIVGIALLIAALGGLPGCGGDDDEGDGELTPEGVLACLEEQGLDPELASAESDNALSPTDTIVVPAGEGAFGPQEIPIEFWAGAGAEELDSLNYGQISSGGYNYTHLRLAAAVTTEFPLDPSGDGPFGGPPQAEGVLECFPPYEGVGAPQQVK